MKDIYDDLHEFNGNLLKHLLYNEWEDVKVDLINFVNSLTSVKQDCVIEGYSENNFYVRDLVEDEVDVLTKEEFFEFLGRAIYGLYIEEMVRFNYFAMNKIFGVSRYSKIK